MMAPVIALCAMLVALAAGAAHARDLEIAARELWRPLITIIGIMATSSSAAELGVFARLAGWIEPRTRGPVRHGFRFVFALSAATAALLSNDAAILLVTPVVIELIRAVYPYRKDKLVVPFAFAAFVAAGVAPLPTGNPMNLVVASRAGIDFNTYAIHMLPVAIVGWLVAYAALAYFFRDVLADEVPAPGDAPPVVKLGSHARVALWTMAASVAAYPILAALHTPLWIVAAPAAAICVAAAHASVAPLARIARGVSWELVPFIYCVLVLATALANAGATDRLGELYARTPFPLPTVGIVGALGSALINNHPMALLHSVTLAGAPNRLVYAALVGGDLGPRLLPIGSLAGLLWLGALRRNGVRIPLMMFVRVGLVVTIPSLVVSLLTLWLVT